MQNPSDSGERLTRRQFSRLVTSSAATLLMANSASADEPPTPAPASPGPDDPRLTQLKRERSAPLTPEQEKGLPAQMKDWDETRAELRKFPLRDGDSEPKLIFDPAPGKERPRG